MDTILWLDAQGLAGCASGGVVVFLGNVTVTALWKALADRTRHAATVAFAQRLVTLTDWVFTAGGVAVILVSGYAMAWLSGWGDLSPGWLRWGHRAVRAVRAGLGAGADPDPDHPGPHGARFDPDGPIPPVIGGCRGSGCGSASPPWRRPI